MVGLPKLVLASSSPRRRELLAQIGAVPGRMISPDIDEVARPDELPAPYTLRMAIEKSQVVERAPDEIVLAGDTTVALGRRILGQAQTAHDVMHFVSRLSGRRHTVFSAVAVIGLDGSLRHRVTKNIVRFKRLSREELSAYADSGEGIGKAGGYAIQGLAAGFVDFISGSYSGIVGLPLYETRNLLKAAGLRIV